jgi:acyl carrier protein
MMTNTEIAERLRAIVAKELKRDVSSITPEHTLRGDLGLNSLDAIELMFRIEEEFDLSIPDDDMQGFEKVGNVIDYLQRRMDPSAAASAPAAIAAPAPVPKANVVAPTPKTAAAPPRPTSQPKTGVAARRATPARKAAGKKAKPKEARRRA